MSRYTLLKNAKKKKWQTHHKDLACSISKIEAIYLRTSRKHSPKNALGALEKPSFQPPELKSSSQATEANRACLSSNPMLPLHHWKVVRPWVFSTVSLGSPPKTNWLQTQGLPQFGHGKLRSFSTHQGYCWLFVFLWLAFLKSHHLLFQHFLGSRNKIEAQDLL